MSITYSLAKQGGIELSKNFRVSEFSCPGTDIIKIDKVLISYLQSIRTYGRLSSLEVVSGYRNPSYNKKIGGSTKSRHMAGQAADVRGYRQGHLIPPTYLCCMAEVLGMGGIAIMQTCAHLDIRSVRWWGDENYSNKSIKKLKGGHNSFFTYFEISSLEDVMDNPYSPANSTLRKGSKGDAVGWLQFELILLGNLPLLDNHGNINIDRKFGAITEEAVKNFQKERGLSIDGIAGPDTRRVLNIKKKT